MGETVQLIDLFISRLGEPYENEDPLSDVRCKEVDAAYLKPLERDLRNGKIDVHSCLSEMEQAINSHLATRGNDHALQCWKRCCRGLADFLLRPRFQASSDRIVAAGVVVRLSGYVNTTMPVYVPFREAAEQLSELMWGIKIPYLKTGGEIEIDPAKPDPLSIWQLAKGPASKERTHSEIRTLSSRLMNYMAERQLNDAEVHKADYDEVLSCPGVFDHFGVGSENVVDVAMKVLISKTAAQKLLSSDFNSSETYYPGSMGRRKWFQSLKVIHPPLVFSGAFIQLSEGGETAKKKLDQIASEQAEQTKRILKNCIGSYWQVDHRQYIKAKLACSLFCYAQSIDALRRWFDTMLRSDSHEVSYSAFQGIGLERIKAVRDGVTDGEAELKSLLPSRA